MINQGIPIVNQLSGYDSALTDTCFVQMFLLAHANQAPINDKPFLFGNYLVSITKKVKTTLSSAFFEFDKDIVIEDPAIEEFIYSPDFLHIQRRLERVVIDVTEQVCDSALSLEEMIQICIKNKEIS